MGCQSGEEGSGRWGVAQLLLIKRGDGLLTVEADGVVSHDNATRNFIQKTKKEAINGTTGPKQIQLIHVFLMHVYLLELDFT